MALVVVVVVVGFAVVVVVVGLAAFAVVVVVVVRAPIFDPLDWISNEIIIEISTKDFIAFFYLTISITSHL